VSRDGRPMVASTVGPSTGRLGRPPATSHAQLERIGIHLFTTRGFEATSVDDIADAAGVSRRTFFRYFSAKADVVWGDFEGAVTRMRQDLASIPEGVPLMEALSQAVVRFNHLPVEQIPHHRQRMRLILEVPEVIGRSTLWYATWRGAIVEFAARRLNQDEGAILPRTIGYCALGAAMAAYEQWLHDEDALLDELLEQSFSALATGLGVDVDRVLATQPQAPR
jgi:TetR/AcrR family transcriptional regulator, regulator of mycofactocin system